MIHRFSTLLTIAGLAAGASAQQTMPAVSLQPVSNVQYGSYDFHQGFTVTNGSNRAIGPDTLFDTTGAVSYYYGVIGGNSEKQEWCDEAQLPNRGLSTEEQITGMAWKYCEGGYTGYFDAFLSLYNDNIACAGPSAWVPGAPSFADCLYSIGGLPGSGCWSVTIDLSCGFECVLPDAANPLSGSYSTIGWSMTPFNCNGTPFLGPHLLTQAAATPGSRDMFEWRDWAGLYFGSYAYGGCYWFGGIGPARADFQVAFYGAPIDHQNCYGSNALDTLCLEALNTASSAPPGGGATPFNYLVTGIPPAGAHNLILLVQIGLVGGTDACDQFTMPGSGGSSFTRQVAISPLPTQLVQGNQNTLYAGVLNVPAGQSGRQLILQALTKAAPGMVTHSAQVTAASNGINLLLQ